ncbi:hypothetical protein SLE2022_162830 [Rubroshorea leprosula]
MAEDFARAVEDGLLLAKRVYLGKDHAVAPPKTPPRMERSVQSYLPTAPIIYAVIDNPGIVDNPDMPSYQPYVHGRYNPPALIPLKMNSIELDVDCHLDTAFVRVSGSWRVHCVMGSKSCDCRVAVPMGDQGSILGVDVDYPRKSYSTELIALDDNKDIEKTAGPQDAGFLKPQIFTLTIPQIDGGSNISITLRWSQKLSFHNGQLTLFIPFTFPDYVTPVIKKIAKKEKIQLNINSGTGTEILSNASSHPLKQIRRQAGKLGFFYEADVLTWSKIDFSFSYTVSSGPIVGHVLLQSPSLHDVDQRETFCIYLYSGSQQRVNVFRKEVIFVVDISKSMLGKPLEDTKNALSGALSKLNPEDSFNIIAFSEKIYILSTSMELASKEAIERAVEWIGVHFIAGGGTNMLTPLFKATEMLMNSSGTIPIIFLVINGAVEDEKHIYDVMKRHLAIGESLCPRIYTFGIGSLCNNYFLRMLAMIGRGQYDAAFDLDSIEVQMEKFFSRGLSTVLANITVETLDDLNELEVYPSRIPDLSSESALTICGRYRGNFPNTLKARGVLGDLSSFAADLKIEWVKDIPLDRVLARQQIDLLTAQAWHSENRQLKQKVAKLSMQTHNVSEYTRMILIENYKIIKATESPGGQKVWKKADPKKMVPRVPKMLLLPSLSIGFGNLEATAENIHLCHEEPKLPGVAKKCRKAASNCCGKLGNNCCCMYCIDCCSKMNDQCAILIAQLCIALSCLGCAECCSICCSGKGGH